MKAYHITRLHRKQQLDLLFLFLTNILLQMAVIRSIFVFFLHFELVKVITGPCHGLVCKAQAATFANQLRDGLYNLLNSSTKMEELKV